LAAFKTLFLLLRVIIAPLTLAILRSSDYLISE